MNPELEKNFKNRWPEWFKNLYGDPTTTCLAWGFECGDGWYDLLWQLCLDIEKAKPSANFNVEQVKEKFGGLRFYTSGDNKTIHKLIHKAEERSYQICEHCGSTENVTTEGGWIQTLCSKCRLP